MAIPNINKAIIEGTKKVLIREIREKMEQVDNETSTENLQKRVGKLEGLQIACEIISKL